MRVAWKTDAGKKKKVNEDAVLVDQDAGLFLLADGMSWPKAGDVASGLAVQRAHAWLKDITRGASDDDILRILREAVALAHDEIRTTSRNDNALRGMGTTLIVLCIRGDTAYIAHVGDSRAYLLRNGIELITTDHTLTQEISQDAILRELFFFGGPRVLSRALGPAAAPECDGHRVALGKGDILLLCSDGLTDMLSEKAIEEIIACYGQDIEASAEALIEAANRMGGRDNISVVLVSV